MKYAPVPARSDSAIVVQHLKDVVPSLVQRLDHRAMSALEEILRAQKRELAPTPEHVSDACWRLWCGLLHALGQQARQLELMQREWRLFAQRHALLSEEVGRQQVIIDYIQEHTQGAISRWRDRMAVGKTLDLDALQERQTLAESKVVATIRVACMALEELGHIILARAPENARVELSKDALLGSEGVDVLRAWIGNDRDVAISWLALRALQPALQTVFAQPSGSISTDWVRLLASWLVNPAASSWIQITALEVLGASPHNGAKLLQEHVRAVLDDKDNWHTRAHAVALLIQRFPQDASLMLEPLFAQETYDGVLVAALNAMEPRDEFEALVPAMLSVCRKDSTPPTRVAAVHAFGRFASAGYPNAAIALVERLKKESNQDVLEIVFSVLHEILEERQNQLDMQSLVNRIVVIVNHRMFNEHDAALAHKLAKIRLQLRDLIQTKSELTTQLLALEAGQSCVLPRDTLFKDLARAMQQATAKRYGLYARQVPKGWRVQRGQRFVFKPWRIIHEIRNPSPNKRQDTSHSRGRQASGWLRAHSDTLGEVTPTTVPGERRMVHEEGGWGTYLPLVDDLLDAQRLRRAHDIVLVSEAGLTRLSPAPSRWVRLKNYIHISWRYEAFDLKRSQALKGQDAAERGRYLEDIESTLGMSFSFEPHDEGDVVAPPLQGLFSETMEYKQLTAPEPPPAQLEAPAVALPVLGALFSEPLLTPLQEIGTQFSDRLFSRGQVRGQELLVVMVAALMSFVMRMVWVRTQVDMWRRRIPLSVGGWGTRGKSGTERLKAGMFQGLGYDVFVKTTGCEAMFIHAPRQSTAREIFIYRPYDKASIWEQRDLLGLGQAMQTDVFMWECMALNPRYVEILQSVWMRDDIVTLTNAYPDHEDIQGPTGVDVAQTIAKFIPKNRKVITAEREMLPILRERARAQQSELIMVGVHEEMQLSHDVMDRFPYREHPRNIALVKRLAEELRIDPEFALFAMADDVVPDLGVLKVYPEVNLLGRTLTFINGCSANERAGFMNNWLRMDLHQLNPREQPDRVVVTVVNNRADRIARSRVFADILVSDIAFDHHILIGTNLSGLRTYMDEALNELLNGLIIIEQPDEKHTEPDAERCQKRLRALIERFRLIDHSSAWLAKKLLSMAKASGASSIGCTPEELNDIITGPCSDRDTLDDLIEAVKSDVSFRRICTHVTSQRISRESSRPEGHPELLQYASPKEFEAHAATQIATLRMAYGLHRLLLDTLPHAHDSARVDAFHARVGSCVRERFWVMTTSLEDPQISGDGIVVEVARHVAPGCHVQIMGTQNIKGTGLDFVYRWVDLGDTMKAVKSVHPVRKEAFHDAMIALAATDAFRLTEVLAVRAHLLGLIGSAGVGAREKGMIQRALEHLEQLCVVRWQAAQPREDGGNRQWRARLLGHIEVMLDPLDAVWRRRRAEALQRLFIARRISHKRMASEMQELNKRQKGGWLAKTFSRKPKS